MLGLFLCSRGGCGGRTPRGRAGTGVSPGARWVSAVGRPDSCGFNNSGHARSVLSAQRGMHVHGAVAQVARQRQPPPCSRGRNRRVAVQRGSLLC